MKKAVLSACVVAAIAGSAMGQSSAPVRMELRIVRQTGTPANPGSSNPVTDVPGGTTGGATVPANTTPGSVTTTTGSVLRFEVQYRVYEVPDANGVRPGNTFPSGLSSATIDITSGTGTLNRAQLSRQEAQQGGAPISPDTSGLAIGNSSTTDPAPIGSSYPNSARKGLILPFRGGMANASFNELPANGITNVNTSTNGPGYYLPGTGNTLLEITPLAISNPEQGDELIGQDPNAWWGLYSFTYTVGATNDTININNVADATTHNTFGYFADGGAVPITSDNSQGASYRIIVPAPGAAALFGIGGLMMVRRRRNA